MKFEEFLDGILDSLWGVSFWVVCMLPLPGSGENHIVILNR